MKKKSSKLGELREIQCKKCAKVEKFSEIWKIAILRNLEEKKFFQIWEILENSSKFVRNTALQWLLLSKPNPLFTVDNDLMSVDNLNIECGQLEL